MEGNSSGNQTIRQQIPNQSGYRRVDRGLWGYTEMWHSEIGTSLIILFINLTEYFNVIPCTS